MKQKRRFRDTATILCAVVSQFGFGAGCQSSNGSASQEKLDHGGSGGSDSGSNGTGGRSPGGGGTGGMHDSCQAMGPPVIVEDIPGPGCGGYWLQLVQGEDAPIPFSCTPIEGEESCACFLPEVPESLNESDLLVLLTGGTPRNAELARLEFDEECPGGYSSRRVDYETLYSDCAWLKPRELIVRVPEGVSGSFCDYTMTAILEAGREEMSCSGSSGTCFCRLSVERESKVVRFELMEDNQLVDTWSPPFDFAPEIEGGCPEPEYGDWKSAGKGGMGGGESGNR